MSKWIVKLIVFILPSLIGSVAFALETTSYGKIKGIETRAWGLHVQTNFSGGNSLGCPVSPGSPYMFDLVLNSQGENANAVVSVILAAFAAGKDVSFHLYECRPGNTRPIIGHVRVK